MVHLAGFDVHRPVCKTGAQPLSFNCQEGEACPTIALAALGHPMTEARTSISRPPVEPGPCRASATFFAEFAAGLRLYLVEVPA